MGNIWWSDGGLSMSKHYSIDVSHDWCFPGPREIYRSALRSHKPMYNRKWLTQGPLRAQRKGHRSHSSDRAGLFSACSGLQALSIQRVKVILPQEVLFALVSTVGGANMDIIQETSTRKSVRLWSNKQRIFFYFGKVEVWQRVCYYSDIITTSTLCSFYSTSTLQHFNPINLVFARVFHILWFYIILRPSCDITSPLICINQDLDFSATKNAITIK